MSSPYILGTHDKCGYKQNISELHGSKLLHVNEICLPVPPYPQAIKQPQKQVQGCEYNILYS